MLNILLINSFMKLPPLDLNFIPNFLFRAQIITLVMEKRSEIMDRNFCNSLFMKLIEKCFVKKLVSAYFSALQFLKTNLTH